MFNSASVLLGAAAAIWLGANVGEVNAAAKCTSIQARCAVEIGGTCDPVTGHWVYGRRGVGGSNKGGRFDACVTAALAKRKK